MRVVVIQPTRGWRALDLAELWSFRELWWFLALRDLKVRYRQTLLGVLWAIVPPLTTVAVFNLLFGLLLGAGRKPTVGDIPYAVSTYCALLPWQLFARIFSSAGNSLVTNRHLITKIYFPRLIMPLAPVGVAVVDFLLGAVVLAGMMFAYEITPTWRLATLPLFVVLAVVAALAVALWLSAINALYRDVQHTMPFLLQLWMFVTPVLYSTESVLEALPAWARWSYGLNPMVSVVEGFRWAMLGAVAPSPAVLALSCVVVAGLFVAGLYFFRRMERRFTDLI